MKRLATAALAVMVIGCTTPDASPSQSQAAASSAPSVASAEPSESLQAAWEAEICASAFNTLVMDIGAQMGVAVDAVFAGDAVAIAREKAALALVESDLRASLDRAPDYPPGRILVTRMRASLDLFDQGLGAGELAQYETATGLFQASLDAFNEAKGEYPALCEQ